STPPRLTLLVSLSTLTPTSLLSHIYLSSQPPSFAFFFNDTATTEIYTLSLHDALPISRPRPCHRSRSRRSRGPPSRGPPARRWRSEEHTSELQSHLNLVCRLLLEKKKKKKNNVISTQ